jgi:hypothetical protein
LTNLNNRCDSSLSFHSRNDYYDNVNVTKIKEIMKGLGNDFRNLTWESLWLGHNDRVYVALFDIDLDTRKELLLNCESFNYEKPGRGEIYVSSLCAKAFGVFFYPSKITFDNIRYLAESRRYDISTYFLLGSCTSIYRQVYCKPRGPFYR